MYSIENLEILFLGVIAAISILIKSLLSKTKWSSIPFYILFGLAVRQLIALCDLEADSLYKIISIFGDVGLILILFQVGVESNLNELVKQMKNALLISIPEVTISGLAMFIPFYYILNLPLQIALTLSVAFTATSIAISITPWKELDLLKKKSGQLVLDLSAMDDIAGITLMVIMFSFFGTFANVTQEISIDKILISTTWIIFKLLLLILFAYTFSVFGEPKLSKFIRKYEIGPDPVVTIICLALTFSALAGFFGLSLALGSFLIGLAFSRDPLTVQLLSSYQSLDSFFIPFFFFSIGFSVIGLSSVSLVAITILCIAAIIGKVIGVAIPSYLLKLPFSTSFLLGLSMVPRAEVALVVMGYAKSVFNITSNTYSECIIVILITCFFPLLITSFVKKNLKTLT